MDKKQMIVFVFIAIFGIGLFSFFIWNKKESKQASSINSYEECVAAGYPVLNSYPAQCSANGKTFTETVQQ